MNKNDLKREHGLSDESNQAQSDAKKIQLESDHQSEGLSNHANCSNVKLSFVEECRDLAIRGKVIQIALKNMKTTNDFSSPGINCYLFYCIVFISSLVKKKNI